MKMERDIEPIATVTEDTMTVAMFRSGLLWKINHDILHPHGLALGIHFDPGDEDQTVMSFTLLAAKEPWTFSDDDNRTMAAKFKRWIKKMSRIQMEGQ